MKNNFVNFSILFLIYILNSSYVVFPPESEKSENNCLVGYWPMNGSANDISVNLNHGSVVSATLTSDRNGVANKAFLFNGNSHIDITGIPLDLNGDFTLSYWEKVNSSTSSYSGCHFDLNDNGICNGLVIWEYNNDLVIGKCGTANSLIISDPIASLLNVWHFWTITKTSNSIKIYKNGTLYKTGSLSFNSNTLSQLTLGNENNSGSGSFNQGASITLDEVKLWCRALDITEIKTEYQGIPALLNNSSSGNIELIKDINGNNLLRSHSKLIKEYSLINISGSKILSAKVNNRNRI